MIVLAEVPENVFFLLLQFLLASVGLLAEVPSHLPLFLRASSPSVCKGKVRRGSAPAGMLPTGILRGLRFVGELPFLSLSPVVKY